MLALEKITWFRIKACFTLSLTSSDICIILRPVEVLNLDLLLYAYQSIIGLLVDSKQLV